MYLKMLAALSLSATLLTPSHAQDMPAGHGERTSTAVEAAIELPPVCKLETASAADGNVADEGHAMPAAPVTDASVDPGGDPARQALIGPLRDRARRRPLGQKSGRAGDRGTGAGNRGYAAWLAEQEQ